MSSFLDKTKIYNKYAIDVTEGRIVACKRIRQACKRYLSWFERDDYFFDYEDLDRKIRFTERLRHWEGPAAGTQFKLLPWQQWVYAGIFAWKYTDSKLRVTDKALIFCARKNGKSSLCSAILLTCSLCDGTYGGQAGCFANSSAQSNIMFNMASKYARSIDPKGKIFKRYRSEIRIPHNDSKIFCKSSDVESLDGANYSVFIMDEVHMQKTSALYDVLRSSQQARPEPLAIMITTAGVLGSGYFLYDTRQYCLTVLDGLVEDDKYFMALYELDEDDDWKDPAVWEKSNPSLGYTVIKKNLATEVKSAINNAALEPGVKIKNFNLFVQSSDVWIQDRFLIDSYKKVDMNKLKGERCWVGVDLSSVSDFTSWSIMWIPNKNRTYYPDKYIFKSFVYIPQDAMENSVNHELYARWVRQKEATVTPGNVIDYDYILTDQIDTLNYSYCEGIYLDPYNSTQYQISAEAAGLPMNQFSQGLLHFNGPTKQFEILIKSGQVIIDKNSLVHWCFGNVQLKSDHNENVKPMKMGGIQSKKIDPIISMVEALGGYMENNNYVPQIYAL